MSIAEQILLSKKKIEPYVHRTPILTSSFLDSLIDAKVFLKCENFQKMGAFKMRGALNVLLSLPKNAKKKGVVTHSSGNFAQAVSLAAKTLGIKAHIVMPSNAPQVKKDAVKGYGGIIYESESTITARQKMADIIAKKEGATFVHPSNDYNVILGNATAALELLETYPHLQYILTPVGGGGLIAGTAMAAHFFGENCKTIGGEPKSVDDAFRSLQSGKIELNLSTNTIADGLRTHLGAINFPIIQKYVDRIITVTEEEIIAAMKLIWERMKIIIEPSSAVPIAALIKEKGRFKGASIGIIISGGNVDFTKLPF